MIDIMPPQNSLVQRYLALIKISKYYNQADYSSVCNNKNQAINKNSNLTNLPTKKKKKIRKF
jgi:RAB protein geranylgeranyltransferase component A